MDKTTSTRGLSPLRGSNARMAVFPGLTPGATIFRSFGADEKSRLVLIQRFFAHNFIQRTCFLARGLTRGWDGENADGCSSLVAADGDLVAYFYRVRRLCDISVDGDAGAVTEFLGQRAATTEPTRFKEEVETHGRSDEYWVMSDESGPGPQLMTSAYCSLLTAYWSYGLGKIPSILPFFFFSPGSPPPLGIPFSAVFSGVIFNIGYTAAA